MIDILSTLGITPWTFYEMTVFYGFAVVTFFRYKAVWAKYLFTVIFVIFAIGVFVNSNSTTAKVYSIVMVGSLISIELLANRNNRNKRTLTSENGKGGN